MTADAAKDLSLAVGSSVVALIKVTKVSLAAACSTLGQRTGRTLRRAAGPSPYPTPAEGPGPEMDTCLWATSASRSAQRGSGCWPGGLWSAVR
ncbi:hypothetical protein AB0D54_38500 [Streptomyces xanthophaeus]|uniref:hypothetical protein n=1 Tax=Streptomyces xanthophaeus TaxID=67385 RepID=UPI00343EE836